MMHPLELSHGHLVAHLPEGAQLLDTGSPFTFPAPEEIRRSIGPEVRGILGMDWLDGKVLGFDLIGGQLEVDGPLPAGNAVGLARQLGVPLVPIEWHGQTCQAVLDTGAQLSYAPAAVVEAGRAVETRRDFYPGFGEFEVETSVVDLQIGSRRVAVRVGALPQGLGALIGAFGLPEWIIGAEIFHGARVCLDLVDDRLVFAA